MLCGVKYSVDLLHGNARAYQVDSKSSKRSKENAEKASQFFIEEEEWKRMTIKQELGG